MSKINLVILVIIGILIFVIGGGIGLTYKTEESIDSASLPEALGSKVITSIMASGEVTSIDGKIISLVSEGESLAIKIRDDATIYSFKSYLATEGSFPIQEEISFQDIRKGDVIDIRAIALPSGQLEGLSIVIPPINQ